MCSAGQVIREWTETMSMSSVDLLRLSLFETDLEVRETERTCKSWDNGHAGPSDGDKGLFWLRHVSYFQSHCLLDIYDRLTSAS